MLKLLLSFLGMPKFEAHKPIADKSELTEAERKIVEVIEVAEMERKWISGRLSVLSFVTIVLVIEMLYFHGTETANVILRFFSHSP